MKVYKRICLRDWHVEAANGDRQDCTRGKTYTTSEQHDDGTVTVMSSFWIRAPVDIFEPQRELSNKGTTEMNETCKAIEDKDNGVWNTECGHYFGIHGVAPSYYQVRWCPFCGKRLQEVPLDAGIKPRNIQHVPFTAAGWSGK